ncbi:MAG: hypothetical protein VB055_05235 [Oscillospiraceae bacterium]|nr:hypothetical protein [Oscillospiraceae bacterium]
MTYNCPKCHCTLMFEEHGKMVCLDCGHRCSKLAAAGAEHVHTHVTYTGRYPGRPETVRTAPQTGSPQERTSDRSASAGNSDREPRPAGTRANPGSAAGVAWRPHGNRPVGCAVPVIVLVILFLLPTIFGAVENAINQSDSSTYSFETSASQETAAGVCYVFTEGDVDEAHTEKLNDAALAYNLKHNSPDVDEVADFFLDYLENENFTGGVFSYEQEGRDVCVTFTAN